VLLREEDVPVEAPVRGMTPWRSRSPGRVDDRGEVLGRGRAHEPPRGEGRAEPGLVRLAQGRRRPSAGREAARVLVARMAFTRGLSRVECRGTPRSQRAPRRSGSGCGDVLVPEVGEDRHRDGSVREDRQVGRRPAEEFRRGAHLRAGLGAAPGTPRGAGRRAPRRRRTSAPAPEVGKGGKVEVRRRPARGALRAFLLPSQSAILRRAAGRDG